MTVPFNPAHGLILVRGNLAGFSGSTVLRLVLDTGSSHTVIDSGALNSVGIAADQTAPEFRVNTPTGTGTARQVRVPRLTTLGKERSNFPIMTYKFIRGLRFDGLLGLNFLRGHRLTIDFPAGNIELI